ncbi:MAG: hypothetical protein H0T46_07635 [Deltaproteobacteria bacterium]|nr:hypothetical protein [Deltaproteobacteria bacterium]
MKSAIKLTIVVASLGLAAACTDDSMDTGSPPPPGSTTSGDENNTFDHMNEGISPWELLDRLLKEGPPRYTSKVHSCPKIRYATLGRVLTSLGVPGINAATAPALSAADLYNNGDNALGAPNYANRIRENIGITTSGASREFDIFAAAAPQIITAIPTLDRCKVGGATGSPASLFNASNQCEASGITCLLGVPAQAAHLDLCNLTIQRASSVDVGKRLAVAALLAASYTCE